MEDSMSEDKRTIDIVERLVRIETILQQITENTVNMVNKMEFKALEDRVDKLENTNIWLGRAVVGTVVVGLLALLFSTK